MPKTEVKLEFVGMAGVNSFIACNSSPRSVMDSSHFSSHLPLLTPDEKIVKSGIEYELGKYINDIRAEHDYIVKAIIPRYKEYNVAIVPTYTLLVEYEEDGITYLDYINVDTYSTAHTFFGYNLHPTQEFMNIGYNDAIPKDTILATTDSYGKEGAYKYGLSASVAFMSHPSVSEDGFVISESFAKKARFNSIIKRSINITKDVFPVNLYGTDEKFKFLPDIGENVRPDGLLCALRKRNDWFSVSDLSDVSLKEVDTTFDNLIYVNPNSTVIDIKIIRGNYNKQEFSSHMTEQLDNYSAMMVNYLTNVVNKHDQLITERKNMYGPDSIRLTPRLHRFITDSITKLTAVTSNKIKLCYRKLPIDQYRIEITTMSTITPNIGYKFTDISAAKGVVCRILPDSHMPTDKNGVRADIITDSTSTISRMNLARAYESYLGSLSRDTRMYLTNYYGSKYKQLPIVNITDEDLEYFRTYIHGLYSLINPDMVDFLNGLNKEEMIYHLNEIITDNLYIYFPPDNEYNITDVITNIEASKYKPLNDTVTYIDELGRQVETKEKIRIGQLYFMVLEKIANTYSAVSSSKVNNFGFPIKGTNLDKYKYPHSLTPTKVLGETEVRILTSLGEKESIADLIDTTLNPISHKFMIKNILESENAFSPKFNVDRSIVGYGQTKSLMILQHICNAAGFTYDYEQEKQSNE